MSKTFVSIIMWSSNRFLSILCAVVMLLLSGISLSAAEKQKSKRLEDGSLYRYPLLDGLIVGVDLFQPVVSLFGQQYANYQVSLEVSFHNRPTIRLMMGILLIKYRRRYTTVWGYFIISIIIPQLRGISIWGCCMDSRSFLMILPI